MATPGLTTQEIDDIEYLVHSRHQREARAVLEREALADASGEIAVPERPLINDDTSWRFHADYLPF